MNSLITVPLCILSWVLTLVRLKTILRQGIKNIETASLNVLGMLFFFSIMLTFLIVEFAAFFNAQTFPNLSLWVANTAFLISAYISTATLLAESKIPNSKKILGWLSPLLVVFLVLLFVLYLFFISKMPATLYFTPQSLPEVIFRLLVYLFTLVLCIIVGTAQAMYLPSKTFAVTRLRAILIILCMISAGSSLFIRIVTFSAYFWPSLVLPALVPLSYISLTSTLLLFLLLFLNNRIYAQLVILSINRERWCAFQDIQQLVERLLILCPPIGLLPGRPNFIQFLFDSEIYLYRALIIILDSKVMLADFLAEVPQTSSEIVEWAIDDNEELLQEATRINQALQAANPSNDFSDMVETYRRVSLDLFASQKLTGV